MMLQITHWSQTDVAERQPRSRNHGRGNSPMEKAWRGNLGGKRGKLGIKERYHIQRLWLIDESGFRNVVGTGELKKVRSEESRTHDHYLLSHLTFKRPSRNWRKSTE